MGEMGPDIPSDLRGEREGEEPAPYEPTLVTGPTPPREGALGIEGLTETVGKAGERKFTMRGKPETDREKLTRIESEADRMDKEADYHEAKLDQVLTFMGGDPSRINPELQKMISNRQRLAKQFRGREKELRTRATDMREMVMGAEVQKEVATVEATGRTEAEQVRALTRYREQAQEAVNDLYGGIEDIFAKFRSAGLKGQEDLLAGMIYSRMSPVMPYLSETYEIPFDELDRVIKRLAEFATQDPVLATATLNKLVMTGQLPTLEE